MEEKIEALRRLRWKCRRGMLEVDLLLEGFLNTHYDALKSQQKEQFECLLDISDPSLFSWLLGSADPKDPALLAIVKCVRDGATKNKKIQSD